MTKVVQLNDYKKPQLDTITKVVDKLYKDVGEEVVDQSVHMIVTKTKEGGLLYSVCSPDKVYLFELLAYSRFLEEHLMSEIFGEEDYDE